jgi:site-specific DNA-methyltransferase (adenine-specific)
LKLIYKDEYAKVIQGDCLEVMDKMIEKGIKVDMILADLPYGTTQNKWDSIIPLDELWLRYEKIIKENGAIVLTAQTPFDKVLGCSNLKLLKYEWIWEKSKSTGYLNARKMPMKSHENVLVFYKKPPTYNPQMTEGKPYKNNHKAGDTGDNYGENKKDYSYENEGIRFPKSIQYFESIKTNQQLHPTQKPLDMFEYFINTYTNENEIILDNVCGSGTTLVAARNLKRKCYGIELDERYCQIAKERLENTNIIT